MLFASLFYYRDSFHYWFISDDFVAIFHSTATIKEIFLDNRLSNIFYTPLAVLALKPDFVLFGLNPIPYHLHNFIILLLVILVFYKILRLFVHPYIALSGSLLVLFSQPALAMVSWIVLRQYLYATLFSLLTISLFLRYKPTIKTNPYLTALILIFTLLAFLGKEQFMTLPFVLLILAPGGIKKRVADTSPFFLLLICYFLFRAYVLKGFGGYIGMSLVPETYLATVIQSPVMSTQILFGHQLVFPVIFTLLLLASMRRAVCMVFVWVMALGIQLLTLGAYPDALSLRYWLIPCLLIITMVCLCAEALRNKIITTVFLLSVTGFFLWSTLNTYDATKASFSRESSFYKSAGNAIVDEKYSGSLIILLDDFTLERGYVLKMIDAIYYEKLGMKTYAKFMPGDFLILYPKFFNNRFSHIYELNETGFVKIPSQIDERLSMRRQQFLPVVPSLTVSRDAMKRTVVHISCGVPSKNLIFYFVTRRGNQDDDERIFYDRVPLPYAETFPLSSVTKLVRAEVLPKDAVSFDGKSSWLVKGRDIQPFPSEALTFFSCLSVDNRITSPTDFLFLRSKADD
jgi:hypothetical protein